MNNRLRFADAELKHCNPIQIRFSDYDTFGHINNNAMMAYFDLGKSMFFNHLLENNVTPDRLGAVIVNINVDFLSPAVIGEPLEVQTAVVAVGDRSFTLYQRVVNRSAQSVKAQASTVLAGFNIATQGNAPLSSKLKEALTRHLIPTKPDSPQQD